MTDDQFTVELKAGNAMVRAGDRAGGRAHLEALWARAAEDPFRQCVAAHHLADAQDDLSDELAWDLRALDAALRCIEADIPTGQSIAAFMPSLHVSLAQDYARLRQFAQAREHLAAGRDFAVHLPDDAYGQQIRAAIVHLAGRLDELPLD